MVSNNQQEQLPLYRFFERLRKNNFPLGVSEYQTLLFVLKERLGLSIKAYCTFFNAASHEGGGGINSGIFPRAEILQLCKLLWLKPGQSTKLFEDIYEECLSLEDEIHVSTEESIETSHSETISEDNLDKDENRPAPEPIKKEGKEGANGASTTITVSIGISKRQANDEIRLRNSMETEKTKFLFLRNYFPIDKRKINQNLRMISTVRPSINSSRIDVGATVQKTVDNGVFQEVLFEKYNENAIHFLLLIDHHGSMIAFQPLADIIKSVMQEIFAVRQSSVNSKFHIYYFYNSPGEHLYSDIGHTRFESKEKILGSLKGNSTHVIIFSDGGAARGSYNKKRIDVMQIFLRSLYEHSRKIVWLNPMPAERWKGTSADEISENIAMFEANEIGIKNAVDLLKGSMTAKLTKYGKSD